MRRLAPWLLLGLLTLGGAAGIALGVADQPGPTPAQWLANAVAATVRAGTLRVIETDVSSSANPELRSDLTTTGLYDFTHDAVQQQVVTSVSVHLSEPFGLKPLKSITQKLDFVVRGRDVYTGIVKGRKEQWGEEVDPRNASPFFSPGGTSETPLIPPGLNDLSPVTAVRDVGTAVIAGERTTEYTVSLGPSHVCPGTKTTGSDVLNQYPQTVWIDREGRIVQQRSVVRWPSPPAPVLHQQLRLSTTTTTTQPGQFMVIPLNGPQGTSLDVTTLRFTDFGAPVSIKAPSVPSRDIHRTSVSTSSAKVTLCPTYSLGVGHLSGPSTPLHTSKALHKEPMLRGARRPPR